MSDDETNDKQDKHRLNASLNETLASMSNSLQAASSNLAAAVDKHAGFQYHRPGSSPQLQSTASTSSHASSSGAFSMRNNLDPRQNRLNLSKANSSERHASKRKYGDDELKLTTKDEDSSTPVRDENSPSLNTASNEPKGNNPLDFLTKFINKSSSIQTIQIPSIGISSSSLSSSNMSAGSSSTNLSYLVNSLKKFVNTNTTSHLDLSQQGLVSGQQQQQQPYSGQYFDPANSFQAQYGNEQQHPRPDTPTKDEVYQPPLPPSTSPQFVMSQQAPPPPLPPPQSLPFHSMYQMQPPPPPPPMNMMSIPPPPPPPLGTSPQLMIDPNSFHQNYMYNQPPPQISPLGGYQYPGAKMLMSPSLSNPISPVNASLKSQPNQMNSPTNNNSSKLFANFGNLSSQNELLIFLLRLLDWCNT